MTNRLQQLPLKDLEQLSAYLDGELSERETRRLESRLKEEPRLQAALQDLRQTSQMLSQLPEVRVPRSFTVSPEMVGEGRRSWQYPLMQLATAAAAFAFLVVVGFDAVTTQGMLARGASPLAEAPAMEQAVPAEDFAEEGDAELQMEESAESSEAPAEGGPEAQSEGTSEPSAAAQDEAPQPEEEALEEQRAMEPPTPTPTPQPTPTSELQELPVAAVPSGGPTRELLRWTEIGLAALVIVLAGWTYRLRPGRE
ncbi:MAG: anti-sigma factor family protein [Anaerolineales bacterium]